MTEFTVHIANRPGMLADLTETLAYAGVNVEALAAYGVGEEGYVRLVVTDAATTRRTLRKAGLASTERKILTTIISHEPGSLARIARQLANSEVNIDALYLLNSTSDGLELAIAVADTETAREHLEAS